MSAWAPSPTTVSASWNADKYADCSASTIAGNCANVIDMPSPPAARTRCRRRRSRRGSHGALPPARSPSKDSDADITATCMSGPSAVYPDPAATCPRRRRPARRRRRTCDEGQRDVERQHAEPLPYPHAGSSTVRSQRGHDPLTERCRWRVVGWWSSASCWRLFPAPGNTFKVVSDYEPSGDRQAAIGDRRADPGGERDVMLLGATGRQGPAGGCWD